ncbi:MAG: sigma-70 family RNA polymerase sigma factor [Saprospiraceae bacterium]
MPLDREYRDDELIEGCLRNNRLWQERLYKKYFESMYNYCNVKLQDESISMTVINNGFLKVFKSIQNYKSHGPLDSWIRKIIYNCMIDELRSNKKYSKTVELEDHLVLKDSFIEKFFEEDLLKLINNLPESTAHVFRLFAIDGYSHEEISQKLKISSGTSKWHVSNARILLKNIIEKSYAK